MTANSGKDTDKNKDILQLINNSSEIAGSTIVGLAAGLLSGDPIVGVASGVGSKAVEIGFRMIGSEIAERMIGPRQKVRAGTVIAFAAAGIRQRLEKGEHFRDDGFFDKTDANYSNMDEAIESNVIKVMETTEENKIKFMANLIETVHFDSDLDIDTYRRILKHLEELSYRQLCIIRLFMNVDRIDLDNIGNSNITQNLYSILTDCLEVRDKGFINSNNPLMEKIDELYLGSSGDHIVFGIRSPEYPGFANPAGFANMFSESMFKFAKLDKIPDEDINSILRELKPESTDISY